MTFLAVIGVVVITVALLWLTVSLGGGLYVSMAFSGGPYHWKEWVLVVVVTLVLAALWVLWFVLVGVHIHVGIS